MDVTLLGWHFLTLQLLDSPYKLIAADIDNSGGITPTDYVLLYIAVQTSIPNFPNNTSWRFIDAGYEFPDEKNPWLEPFPEIVQVNNLMMDTTGVDFIGIKIGNLSYDAPDSSRPEGPSIATRYSGTLPFVTKDIWMEPGQNILVNFYAKDFRNIVGLQLEMDFDPEVLEVVNILPGNLDHLDLSHFGRHQEEDGKLFLTWSDLSGDINGTVLEDEVIVFSLILKSKQYGNLKNHFSFTADHLAGKAYQAIDPGEPNGIALLDLRLDFKDTPQSQTTQKESLTVRPNPTRKDVMIDYVLKEQTKVNINVYSVIGDYHQEVQATTEQNSGRYAREISLARLPEGIYFIKVTAGDKTWTKRVVKIEEH